MGWSVELRGLVDRSVDLRYVGRVVHLMWAAVVTSLIYSAVAFINEAKMKCRSWTYTGMLVLNQHLEMMSLNTAYLNSERNVQPMWPICW